MTKVSRIACHGFFGKQSGSVASGNFLILEELLKRGLEIDLYGWGDSTEFQEMLEYKNFNYIRIPYKSLIYSFFNALPNNFLGRILNQNIYSLIHLLLLYDSGNRVIQNIIVENHKIKPYDLILFLGLYAPFICNNIPIISWPQGHPQSNWFFIQKNKEKIVALCGDILYFKLMIFYWFKIQRTKKEIKNSNSLICGSQWSKQELIQLGQSSHNIYTLPYPIDINLFQQQPQSRQTQLNPKKKIIFLWLGRSEPRKRLDLLLEAYQLLLQERQDVYLKIIGDLGWAKGYKKLIEQFKFSDYLDYQPYLERTKIPALMSQCDVLIQPSEGENFGSSVAEALCWGLPVIVGPTNGTKDYIGSAGFVFESYKPEALKHTMIKVMKMIKTDSDKLAIQARKTAINNFNIYKVTNDLEAIFNMKNSHKTFTKFFEF